MQPIIDKMPDWKAIPRKNKEGEWEIKSHNPKSKAHVRQREKLCV